MSYNFFALLGRMKYIDRWGLMRNTQVENIQEHSHMVSVLSHALAVIGRERFGRRQSLRPHQVLGGGKGGQQRVPLGGRADQGRPGKDGSARAKLLYGAFPPRL